MQLVAFAAAPPMICRKRTHFGLVGDIIFGGWQRFSLMLCHTKMLCYAFINQTTCMELYDDLVSNIPAFKHYDLFGRAHYTDIGISPLGTVGSWLNELCVSKDDNDQLISQICNYLNHIYTKAGDFEQDVRNDFRVYLFWSLYYSSIERIKHLLLPEILADARIYLQTIDGAHFRDF